ncbi:RNA polymerase sigma factor [Chondrinema litorale]|uniref:RNA polymerase sigma factor n=1 Tax=Chondrinema litorale TaxID=2994555 RepID=UPI002542E86E|nr:RNA polymerase sigma factor [Chondrinema litorale]UZR98682.1 RNA polymerase sigma factor [Chondrinema litorale]
MNRNVHQLKDEEIIYSLTNQFDTTCFNEISKRYETKIFKRCRAYVKDEELARDLTQDIFIKLFLHLDAFKSGGRFSPWLYTIANNTCLDYLRKNRKKYHVKLSEELFEQFEDISELDVDHSLDEDLTMELLEELMKQLPPQDKMVLLLKYSQKLSLKEIQEIMGLGESAVKMRLKRAREKITRLHKTYKKIKGFDN